MIAPDDYPLGHLEADAMSTVVLVSAKRAADILGVSPRTLANWRWRGGNWGPPYVKIGRSVRYSFSEIVNWIEENSFSSTSEADGGA